MALFGIVLPCWVAVPILPFFNFPHKAVIITSLLVGGEILFAITVALLGKAYWHRIKNAARRWFGGAEKEPKQPETGGDDQAPRSL